MMENRYCVIMCGGVGSRFWPFSKSSAPKQFIDFFGTGRSLLQMSFDRVAELVPVRNILAITNERYAPLVKQQLPDLADDRYFLSPTAATRHRVSPGQPTTSAPSIPTR